MKQSYIFPEVRRKTKPVKPRWTSKTQLCWYIVNIVDRSLLLDPWYGFAEFHVFVQVLTCNWK